MKYRRLNYQSDFTYIETFYKQDEQQNLVVDKIPSEEIDFEITYRAQDERTFTVGRRKGIYFNCKRNSDSGIAVFIPLSRNSLGVGELVRELTLFTPNNNFPDSIQRVRIPSSTGCYLHKGASDPTDLTISGKGIVASIIAGNDWIIPSIRLIETSDTTILEITDVSGTHRTQNLRGKNATIVQQTGSSTDTAMSQAAVTEALAGKVDAEAGKGLSTCDFTEALRGKLEGLHTGLVAAPAEATLVAQAGKFYYWTNPASLSVTGVQGFTPEADCAALAVSGNCAVTFGSAFKCQQGIDALEATAAQWKIYIIQWVPVSDAGAILVVNCSIYG